MLFFLIIIQIIFFISLYLSSLSVGSIIKVSGMGKETVGAWNPKSWSLLATSPALMPASCCFNKYINYLFKYLFIFLKSYNYLSNLFIFNLTIN